MFLINLLAIVAPVIAVIAILRAEMTRRDVQSLEARLKELRIKLRAVEAAEDTKKLAAMMERNRSAAAKADAAEPDRPLVESVPEGANEAAS